MKTQVNTNPRNAGLCGQSADWRGLKNYMCGKDRFRANTTTKARCHGYIRVSTRAQATDRQTAALRLECDKLHIEHVAAVADQRPVFERVMRILQPGDTFVVLDLDRVFRSSVDAMLTAADLRRQEVAFRILSLQVDTTTPEGELFYTLLAAFAQFERRIISRRTREGLAAARKRGAKLGRPRVIDDAQIAEAYLAIESGEPTQAVASAFGVARSTLERAFHIQGYTYPIPRKPKGGANA
jgi:DNA invertase Pin-like site-specific DNA recombinase